MDSSRITEESLNILNKIFKSMDGKSFHNHHHIIYDICSLLKKDVRYLEIGAYAGGSASLMSCHPSVISVTSIDLGKPISKDVPIANVKKFKNEKCTYEYIEGSSTDKKIINYVRGKYSEIDILFIDGNHTYDYVINDFNNYKDIVIKNGYIIFDDYLDKVHSPGVRVAVDKIASSINGNEFDVIGSLKYDLLKNTTDPNLGGSNLFILKKI